ncbi:MAG: pyruvate kinase [Bacillota bacterium]|nr:pyruvate kinase [Bacillota bacterium]
MKDYGELSVKRTKIICTLGPACDSEEMLRQMLETGMNAARFNFSHGTHPEQEKRLERFLKVRDETGIPAAAILDTKGPEIRTGNIDGYMQLQEGQSFCLYCGSENCDTAYCCESDECPGVSITYACLCDEVKPGGTILIDDGKIQLEITEISGKTIRCRVICGGLLSGHKGVNVPGVHVGMEYLTERDKNDLLFGIKHGFNYIAASFARTSEDIRDLRRFLDENGGENIGIISKIENQEGVDNFSEILELSDGIMVARGDMGVEIDYAGLPGIQKKIIRECSRCGKIVITATQMLDSMMTCTMPTRAEITDVANAVFDGSSAVMLSGETAAGKYPVQTVETMVKIVRQAEEDMFAEGGWNSPPDKAGNRSNIAYAIGHAACTTAADTDAKALAAITASGHTAKMMAKFKPLQPIVGVTPYRDVFHSMSLVWGVIPVIEESEENWEILHEVTMKKIREYGLAEPGEYVVSSAGIPFNIKGNTNILRVDKIE